MSRNFLHRFITSLTLFVHLNIGGTRVVSIMHGVPVRKRVAIKNDSFDELLDRWIAPPIYTRACNLPIHRYFFSPLCLNLFTRLTYSFENGQNLSTGTYCRHSKLVRWFKGKINKKKERKDWLHCIKSDTCTVILTRCSFNFSDTSRISNGIVDSDP